ncbi:MAG: FAD-dependent oxidoreductase [Alphaproteobacteria bacterium]|nr:FAD-dependent oxidoreductase [Alphaproteobacteria bacterium]
MAGTETRDYDVVVVGCGVAGLSAAVSALECGARVAIVERATVEERGGNTRYTGASIRMASESEISPDFEGMFAANAGYHLDPLMVAETAADYANWPAIVKTMPAMDLEVIGTLADSAPATIGWLKEQGVKFGEMAFYGLTERSSPRIGVTGGGLALVETMAPVAEEKGADFLYETTAQGLIRDDDGRVIGLQAAGANNRPLHLMARGIVLACGGFQGNPEMVAHYLGSQGRFLRPVARGGYYNKGEGIRMALDIGAAPAGDYSDIHTQPIDPRSGATEPLVMIFTQGILVNTEGDRFVDEAPGPIDANYEDICRRINAQPQGLAWCLLDAKLDEIKNWQRCVRSDQPPVEAGDLVDLAAEIKVPADALQATVAAYNAACRDGKFDPHTVDMLGTDDLSPPKTNWARPLDTPPFKAYPVIGSNTFTFGGLKATPDAQVLNTSGEVIPGLYVAGETMGLYYGRYPGATSVLRGAVFGRRAGLHAARGNV